MFPFCSEASKSGAFRGFGTLMRIGTILSDDSVDKLRTVPYGEGMTETNETEALGAEEARNRLPALLDLAEGGKSTVIRRHGRLVAAVVPIALYQAIERARQPKQRSLLLLSGSGAGLWGEDSMRSIREMRDEWTR